MEKAVVRRGIGAVVLALVAALLLGYLLKGKKEDRQQIVSNDLPKAPIQIFPSKEAGAGAGIAGGVAGAAGNAASNVAGAAGNAASNVAGAAGNAASNVAGAAGNAASNVAGAAGNAVSNVAGAVGNTADLAKDNRSGNPNVAAGNSNTVVDKAGQTVFGGKVVSNAGDAAKQVDFNTTAPVDKNIAKVSRNAGTEGQKRVRPAIGGKDFARLKSGGSGNKSKQVAKKNTRPKSRARLVGEKKLKPVGRGRSVAQHSRNIHNKKNQKRAISVAESRQIAAAKKAAAKKAAASKRIAAANKSARNNKIGGVVSSVPVGRNKFTVQLLATSSSSKARSLTSTFKKEGYNAYVSNTSTGGKHLYRVRIGNFSGKSAASQKLTSLKRRYRKNKYVQSSMVVKF